MGILFDQVPFVDDEHRGLALLVRIAGNAHILLGKALARIADDEHHVCTAHRRERTNDAVAFDALVLNATLSSDARGIHQRIKAAIMRKIRIDGIPRGAGHVGNDGAFLAQQRVDDAGLAHIGFSHHGDIDALLLRKLLRGLRKIAHDLVEQISKAQPLRRGKGNRVAQPQGIELVHRFLELWRIDLVYAEHHGLFALSEHGRDLHIRRGHALPSVHEEQDYIRRLNGKLRLPAHLHGNLILAGGLDSAGIDQGKGIVQPLRIAINAVARHARRILHDGDAPADQPVEQGRFAHIGAAYNGDQRF